MKTLLLACLTLCSFLTITPAATDEISRETIMALDQKVGELEKKLDKPDFPWWARFFLVAPIGGAFCALWAQNNKKNAWFWFFFGLILPFIAVIFLLIENSKIIKTEPVVDR